MPRSIIMVLANVLGTARVSPIEFCRVASSTSAKVKCTRMALQQIAQRLRLGSDSVP